MNCDRRALSFFPLISRSLLMGSLLFHQDQSSLSVSEMVETMKNVAGKDIELTVEERNLLSVAYKNVIGARRASWRIISSIEQKEESKGGEDKLKMIREYRQTVRLHFIFYRFSQLSYQRDIFIVPITIDRSTCLCITGTGNDFSYKNALWGTK